MPLRLNAGIWQIKFTYLVNSFILTSQFNAFPWDLLGPQLKFLFSAYALLWLLLIIKLLK